LQCAAPTAKNEEQMSQSQGNVESFSNLLRTNPIALIEEYAINQDWSADRSSDNELWAEIPGQWGNQRLWVAFHDETGFLQLNTYMNIKIPQRQRKEVARALTMMNERVWLGHFEIWTEEHVPVFRIVLPLRGSKLHEEQLADIMASINEETERFFPAIQWIVWGGKSPEEAIAAAIVQTEGEA
jgi:hypothetical protein